MTQLTVRGFDQELERELRRLARAEGISLNQAALRLLRKGAGLSGGASVPIGAALDQFLGTISAADAAEVEQAVLGADAADLEAQRRARAKA